MAGRAKYRPRKSSTARAGSPRGARGPAPIAVILDEIDDFGEALLALNPAFDEAQPTELARAAMPAIEAQMRKPPLPKVRPETMARAAFIVAHQDKITPRQQ